MTAIDGLTTASVEGAVKTANGDVAVKAAASGYSGKDVTVYVAFDAEGAISGISIDGSTQTTGIGSKVSGDSFASGFIAGTGERSPPAACGQHCRCNVFQQRRVQRHQRSHRLLQQ